ncbi:zinc finger protein ZAT3-like [Olea europaea var. sylvestris]|uniref:zinc finger protein ZAT3-like n=1 Tax=Olea europaea var. sylvestris TaxID=158386 RepID=UPI000C1D7754|nr:zinc finger protein ZAT3-like [Olea europaea var. sylvestris]
MEEDGQTIVIQEKDKMYSKFCPLCNKGFNSGKAVGGHMRIHVQATKKVTQPIKSKKRLREDEEISESDYVKKKHYNKKLSCLICGKKFLSMKSLCGHMRCHPERNWRGIQPPTIAKKSSWSKIEPNIAYNQIDSITDADGNQSIDSVESFLALSVTAKRGMSVTSEFSGSEDGQLNDAVLNLMMLAHGGSFENGQLNRQRVVESEVTNSNSLTYKSEIGDTNKVSESKTSIEENGSTNLEGLKMSNKIGSLLQKSASIEEHGRTNAKMTIKNERKKKVRLSDLEYKKYDGPVTTKPPHVKYNCITCGKCFETRQALGGHRASHNKYKTAIYNSIDQSSFAASEDEILSTGIVQVDYESPEIAQKHHKIPDFDLNEVPPLENKAGIESELAADFDYGSS